MSNWITLDPREFSRTDKYLADGGVRVETHLSPYDVPQAVRGHLDDANGIFFIDFKYISADEMQETVKENPGVAIRVGKRSNRLYGINLDARSEKSTLKARIEQFFSAFSKEEPTENHRVARRIIEGKCSQIFSDLVATER